MKLSNRNLVFLAIATGIVFAVQVFAVGSGGGGGVTCTADEWTCTDWSTCSTSGTRTRTCTLTLDCPGFDNPKPAEQESCTPPVPPPAPPPAAPPPSLQPTPTPSPAPAPSPTPTPSSAPACTKDVWQCSIWSQSCDIYGNHNRTCDLVSDCAAVSTPPSATTKRCEKLQCGNLSTLRERIFCRLNLAPAGIARELELQYLPEECRALSDNNAQEACEERYESFQPCWSVPAGRQRFDCARNILKLGPIVSGEVKKCQGLTGQARANCSQDLKNKVYDMIKFRLYDLEQRAERLGERGADLGAVADLEAVIEQAKQDLNNAQTFNQRRQIILDASAAWRNFLKTVKDQVQ